MLVRDVYSSFLPANGKYLDFIVVPSDKNGVRVCRVFDDPEHGLVRQFFDTQNTAVPYENTVVDFVTVESDSEIWIWV